MKQLPREMSAFALGALGIAVLLSVVGYWVEHALVLLFSQSVQTAHALVGWPVHDLLLDIRPGYFLWMPIAMLLALTAASTWLDWRDRLTAALAGSLALLVVQWVGIVLAFSPYLPPPSWKLWLNDMLTLMVSFPLPLLLWWISVGGIPELPGPETVERLPRTSRARPTPTVAARAVRGGQLVTTVVLVTGLLLASVCGMVTDETYILRKELAAQIAQGRQEDAWRTSLRILNANPTDVNVTYLGARLAQQIGHDSAFQIMLYQACAKSGTLRYYFSCFAHPPTLDLPQSRIKE